MSAQSDPFENSFSAFVLSALGFALGMVGLFYLIMQQFLIGGIMLGIAVLGFAGYEFFKRLPDGGNDGSCSCDCGSGAG